MRNEPYLSARRWALIAIIGTFVYVVLDVVVQLFPPHYNALREAESLLAVGPYGYIMNINFLIRGIAAISVIMATASMLALMRAVAADGGAKVPPAMTGGERVGMTFFGIWGVGSFLLGFFNTDTYSRGVRHLTFHGAMHLFLALIAFFCAPIGEILLSVSFGKMKGLRGLGTWALPLGILSALLLLLLFRSARFGYFGLVERMFIGSVLLWGVVVASKMMGVAKGE